MSETKLRVTKLTRHTDPDRPAFHTANVSLDGATVEADTRSGSWQFTLDGDRRELHPSVAAYVESKVPAKERPLPVRRERRKTSDQGA